MSSLVIDAGNTRIKLAVFNQTELVMTKVVSYKEANLFFETLLGSNPIDQILISDVGGKLPYKDWPIKFGIKPFILSSSLKLPFKNLYETPETLGSDRIALVCGAMQLIPGNTKLIIDAGTCVTFDLINSSDEFLGGNISPGLQMRLNAMHHFTGKLPLLDFDFPEELMGTNTIRCMHTGAFYGLVGEIEQFVASYKLQFPDLQVLITGGDSGFLAKKIKTSIFVNEHLLLLGLNKLLIHNAT